MSTGSAKSSIFFICKQIKIISLETQIFGLDMYAYLRNFTLYSFLFTL